MTISKIRQVETPRIEVPLLFGGSVRIPIGEVDLGSTYFFEVKHMGRIFKWSGIRPKICEENPDLAELLLEEQPFHLGELAE